METQKQTPFLQMQHKALGDIQAGRINTAMVAQTINLPLQKQTFADGSLSGEYFLIICEKPLITLYPFRKITNENTKQERS